MLKYCPACGASVRKYDAVCPTCGLDGLDLVFPDEKSYDQWIVEHVEPYKRAIVPRVSIGDGYFIVLYKNNLYAYTPGDAYTDAGLHVIAGNVADAMAAGDMIFCLTLDGIAQQCKYESEFGRIVWERDDELYDLHKDGFTKENSEFSYNHEQQLISAGFIKGQQDIKKNVKTLDWLHKVDCPSLGMSDAFREAESEESYWDIRDESYMTLLKSEKLLLLRFRQIDCFGSDLDRKIVLAENVVDIDAKWGEHSYDSFWSKSDDYSFDNFVVCVRIENQHFGFLFIQNGSNGPLKLKRNFNGPRGALTVWLKDKLNLLMHDEDSREEYRKYKNSDKYWRGIIWLELDGRMK